MKKETLSIVFLILHVGILFSQPPTITRAEYFEIGDTVLVYSYHSSELDDSTSGMSGSDVLWDFAFAAPNPVEDTLFFINPNGTPFNPSYPPYSGSNLCYRAAGQPFSPEENTYTYLFVNEDSLNFIGSWADNGGTEMWEYHCPDMIRDLLFPFTYQAQFEDSLDCYFVDQSGSGEHFQNGINNVIADGYGTLIMPNGAIYENVLRVKTELTFTDSNELFGINKFIIQRHAWYSSESRGPVAIADLRPDGQTIATLRHWVLLNDVTTSIQESILPNQIKVFPTILTDNSLNIINEGDISIDHIKIFNTSGQAIFEKHINNQQLLSNTLTLDLQRGIYIVSIFGDSRIFSYRIMKM